MDENDEVVQFVLVNPDNAELQNNTNTLIILDDDNPPTVSIAASKSIGEAAGSDTITVSLDTASGRELSVAYATQGTGSATTEDYYQLSGALVFAPGETSKTIEIFVIDDTSYENDENFNVVLSSGNNVTLGNTTAISILDNDPAPTLSVPAQVSITESQTSAVIDLALSAVSNIDAVVAYTTTDNTATAEVITPQHRGS